MIIFRADANSTIGSGHVMRCLSIADEAERLGEKVCFITADDSFSNVIKSRGYENIVLNTNYSDMESELEALQKVLANERDEQYKQNEQEKQWIRRKIEAIVVDSYYVTPTYLSKLHSFISSLSPRTKLVYIDDLLQFAYPVDVLINYGSRVLRTEYEKLYSYTKLPAGILLGLDYAPLREEFQGLPFKNPARDVKNVLVSTGGADHEHVALKIIKRLMQEGQECQGNQEESTGGYTFHFTLGTLNQDKEEILSLSRCIHNVIIHQNIVNMHELMSMCDIAVSAGGSTILELCASSLPIITYSVADNQEGIKDFAEKGLALYTGDARECEAFVENIFYFLHKLSSEYELRKSLAENVYSLIDGKGVKRIMREIYRYRFKDYSMRPIEEEDLPQILEWRNSDKIHSKMLTNHKITWGEHYQWFKRIEKYPIKRYFVFEHKSKPIGYIAYNDFNEEEKSCTPGMYIGNAKAAPGDAGFVLSYIIGKYAFEKMGMLKLKSEILASNKNALALNKFFGNTEVGEFYVEKHDKKELVKLLEITKEQWVATQKERLIEFFDDR